MLDCLILLALEAAALELLGMLTNPTPLGDDPLIHVQKIVDLSRNFLHFQWDPRSYGGYVPSVGFAWASYALPALFVSFRLDPIAVFHVTFVTYFLAFGPSIYYLARSIGSPRVVTLLVSVIGWSSVGYWGYIGGGAYGRTFTLPFMFISLALTYRYVVIQNAGRPAGRMYLLLLTTWFVTLLGDVYVVAVPVSVAIIFLLLSAGWKRTRLGLLRLAVILLPPLILTSWFWIPLGDHIISVGSPRSDVTPWLLSQVYWIGPILSLIAIGLRRKSPGQPPRPEILSLLLSLNVVSVYFLVTGAITPLWAYIPRIWATYDSLNILSFLLPVTIACVSVWLKPVKLGMSSRPAALFLVILVIATGIPTIYGYRPPNQAPLTDAFAAAFRANLVSSYDYRVSLQGRTLTRWFPFYYPDASQTGGRVAGLDPNPYYQSWYETEVFFKDDLATLDTVYFDDQPPFNVTSLTGGSQNFASTRYWVDWYGVGTIVLDPAFYPVSNTAAGFSQRGALFTNRTAQTSYGPLVFVRPTEPSPMLVATNASIIGFYSEQRDSANSYHSILALLSYLGLDSRYVVPVYLSSLDKVNPVDFSAIITDEATNVAATARISYLKAQGTRIIVISPTLLEQLQSEGLPGTVAFIDLISPIISLREQNLTLVYSVPAQTLTIRPDQWVTGNSQNANGYLQTNQNNLTLTLQITDPSKTAQFDLEATLASQAVLSDQLTTHLLMESDTKIGARLGLTSSNSTTNSVESIQRLNGDQWTYLQVPFTNFTQWENPQSRFALATGFTISVTVPPGHQHVTIQIGGASLSQSDYAIYDTSGEISLSSAGFVKEQQISRSTTILSDAKGDLLGSYAPGSLQVSPDTIGLGAFASTADESFTRVIFVGGIGAPATIGLVPESSWMPLEGKWTTNEDLYVPNLPIGFRGIVWKATFTDNWNVLGTRPSYSEFSLPYLPAGPGMMYMPLNGIVATTLAISYRATVYDLVTEMIAALFIVPIVLLRRRLYVIGLTRNFSPSHASI